ncbi:hypothetical protein H4O18_05035 [Arenibacter sp. BSSL-BM3]|uniref:Uncharacterized protein n=1 Tax=Arenibacter arenosicollis TaxID=2762274 RepID=A0ABR7QJJ5_9FLAO|nr:hypothetical protein [Arenibacter arenosicollis]MBC8767350.1 hypothetical protein [Arenibacter arenosicollis]
MTTDRKNQDKEKPFRGLENNVPQNHGLGQDYHERESIGISAEELGKPVNNGGVDTTKLDLHLESQWLAVRDEYLSHYPAIKEEDTEYEKGSFYKVIDSIAKSRQRSPEEIRKEIMGWSLTTNDQS